MCHGHCSGFGDDYETTTGASVRDLTAESDGSKRQRELAELYCAVWREPPWNEFDWTNEIVLTKLNHDLALPGAVGYAAESESIVGFTWGYQVDHTHLADIAGTPALDYLFAGYKRVFYLAELAVRLDWRRRLVGKTITDRLLGATCHQQCDLVILRTDDRAEEAIRLYRRLGFRELDIHDANYPLRRYWILSM